MRFEAFPGVMLTDASALAWLLTSLSFFVCGLACMNDGRMGDLHVM